MENGKKLELASFCERLSEANSEKKEANEGLRKWGMENMLVKLLKLYQRVHPAFFRGCCRFYPSCSNYAIEAIEKHGAIKGVGLSVWRILRCQPFCKGGFDPVP